MHVPCSCLNPQANQVWYPYLFCSSRISCIHTIKYHIRFLFSPSNSLHILFACLLLQLLAFFHFFPFLFFLFSFSSPLLLSSFFPLPLPSFSLAVSLSQISAAHMWYETSTAAWETYQWPHGQKRMPHPQRQTSANSSLARGRPEDHTSSVLEVWLAWSRRVSHSCSEFLQWSCHGHAMSRGQRRSTSSSSYIILALPEMFPELGQWLFSALGHAVCVWSTAAHCRENVKAEWDLDFVPSIHRDGEKISWKPQLTH